MKRRTARKTWWATARWHLYRGPTLERAKQRYLADRGLTPRTLRRDGWLPAQSEIDAEWAR